MLKDLIEKESKNQNIVVDSFAEASQLDYLLKDYLNLKGLNSDNYQVNSHKRWLESLIQNNDIDRSLITTFQEEALWQEIIKSDVSNLVNISHASTLASSARQAIKAFNLDASKLKKSRNYNVSSFVRWLEHFDNFLKDNNWATYDDIYIDLIEKNSLSNDVDCNLIFFNRFPENIINRLYSNFIQASGSGYHFINPKSNSLVSKSIFNELSDEISCCISWACQKLIHSKTGSVAIIIPDYKNNFRLKQMINDSINLNIELNDTLDESNFVGLKSDSLIKNQIISSAIKTLEIFDTSSDFSIFSRWLRSPYIDCSFMDINNRSLLEVDLRNKLMSQISFLDSYVHNGLKEYIYIINKDFCNYLSIPVEYFLSLPTSQLPNNWSSNFIFLLDKMGWSLNNFNLDSQIIFLWNEAIKDFSNLTPILGKINYHRALSIFESILNSKLHVENISSRSIYISENIEDISAGYDSIWVSSMNSSSWPKLTSLNPMIPIELQMDLNFPNSSPNMALSYSKSLMKRIENSANEVIYSYSRADLDSIYSSSPLIEKYSLLEIKKYPNIIDHYKRKSKITEEVIDNPPRYKKRRIKNAINIINYQSRFPLLAFLTGQLSCKRVKPLSKGMRSSDRGIITHRTLELIYSGVNRFSSFKPSDNYIRECIIKALDEFFGKASTNLKILYDLEYDRIKSIVDSLLLEDANRSNFSIHSIEENNSLIISGVAIKCRSDRIDKLDDNKHIIIDYKTGSSFNINSWFKDRPQNLQLPLYALIYRERVDALININLKPNDIQYKGLSKEGVDLPTIKKVLTRDQWDSRISSWEKSINVLVSEFVNGDTRINIDEINAIDDYYLPLARFDRNYYE
ncbi:MAG: PD-(D/E)XK nuclease family protein [Pseudomonadota bacterium]|nr:PD-(D/E)XK nuclease family protein [Pseudomonadota bacterium]